jgi:hypothetical protein
MQKMANLAVLVFVSFRFMNFYSQRGDPPPSDAPEGGGGDFFSEKEKGYGMTLHAKMANLAVLVFVL